MSATNTGTPAADSASAISWSVLVLPVPVAPAIRPCRFIIASGIPISGSGWTLPVVDRRAERHRGRGARARKRRPDGREHLGVEGHARTLATGAAGATIGAIDDAVG